MISVINDIQEVYPFQLNGKTIRDSYFTKDNILIIEFTDGTKVRIVGQGRDIQIKKP